MTMIRRAAVLAVTVATVATGATAADLTTPTPLQARPRLEWKGPPEQFGPPMPPLSWRPTVRPVSEGWFEGATRCVQEPGQPLRCSR